MVNSTYHRLDYSRQSDAPVAVQAITLGGKFGRAVHLAQAKAAHKLCRFVVEELRGNVSFKPAREISFLRRVFVRVRNMFTYLAFDRC